MDKNPVFRKIIVAWYDSEPACISIIIIMLMLLLFAIAGLSVATTIEAYSDYTWFPITLIVLCVYMIFSTILQLFRLYSD